ncbi:hypothetical protein [Metabacillus iocasae]|uniref:Molybdopterin synthase catalytic subunit n=1 Tax=Priestia iocasae TaxID=2291674 RepID=A0ABS2R0S4_9BACI|nr:hypothetical protein [Metabacillus iocasae]MBM7704832.1 molybdopterin synthase catalytic subunit [Metabacillus iocasae]
MNWIDSIHEEVKLRGQRDNEDVDALIYSFVSQMTKDQLSQIVQNMSEKDIHDLLFSYVKTKVEEQL